MDKARKLKKLILIFIFLSLSLGQFAKISLSGFVVTVHLWDALICIYIFIHFLQWLSNKNEAKKNQINVPIYYAFLFIFATWAFFVTILSFKYLDNISEFLVSASYLLRFGVYSIFGYFIFYDLKKKNLFLKDINAAILVCGFLICLFGFFQLAFFSDFSKLDPNLLWDPHKNRLAGSFFDPNFTGAFLSVYLTYVFYLINMSYKRKSVLFVLATLALIAIFLTFSRSAWLMLAVIVFVLGFFKYRYLLFLSLIISFSSYYFVPRVQSRLTSVTDQADSFRFRIQSWNEALDIAERRPITGWGFNTYRYVRRDLGLTEYNLPLGNRSGAGSDSSFLLIISNTGVIGLILFILSYISILKDTLTSFLKKTSVLGLFLLSIILGLIVNSQFINSLFYPNIFIIINSIVAIFYFATVNSDPSLADRMKQQKQNSIPSASGGSFVDSSSQSSQTS